jgi:DNA modification methylase/ParB-like chromosome segregation protein Spo0J
LKINVADIHIENPTLEIDEDQLQGLTESMQEKGLSHPIKVRLANDLFGDKKDVVVLASGEKRLLAAKRIGWEQIEADIVDVDAKGARELRLHENLKRFNLPWYDQVGLVEELHNLRKEQHGEPVRTGRPPVIGEAKPKQGWSLRDTARELGVGVGPLSEDLSLARALRDDPTLRKVKDKKTAIRLARNVQSRFESEQSAGLPTTREFDQILFGDATEILSRFPAASFDHCITDPPWIRFFDNTLTIDARTLPVFRELYRVLKYGAFLYVVGGLDDYAYYTGVNRPNPDNPSETIHERGELEKIGFSVANTPVIWQKINSLSRRGVRSWEYDRDFEFVIVAVKGSPVLTTSRKLSGIKSHAIVHPAHMIHPNEKPISLIEDLVTDCSYEGNVIVDPFGGSGVLAEACKKNKRKYVVCERDRKSYEAICKRMGVKA